MKHEQILITNIFIVCLSDYDHPLMNEFGNINVFYDDVPVYLDVYNYLRFYQNWFKVHIYYIQNKEKEVLNG